MRARVLLCDADGRAMLLDPYPVVRNGSGFRPIERGGRIYFAELQDDDGDGDPELLVFREAAAREGT